MTRDEVIERHKKLHSSFDELFACFITQNPDRDTYTGATLLEFMEWAHKMTINPTCHKTHKANGERG